MICPPSPTPASTLAPSVTRRFLSVRILAHSLVLADWPQISRAHLLLPALSSTDLVAGSLRSSSSSSASAYSPPSSRPKYFIPPLVVRGMVVASGESSIMEGVEDPSEPLAMRRLVRSVGRPQEGPLPTTARQTRRSLLRSLSTGLTRYLCVTRSYSRGMYASGLLLQEFRSFASGSRFLCLFWSACLSQWQRIPDDASHAPFTLPCVL